MHAKLIISVSPKLAFFFFGQDYLSLLSERVLAMGSWIFCPSCTIHSVLPPARPVHAPVASPSVVGRGEKTKVRLD